MSLLLLSEAFVFSAGGVLFDLSQDGHRVCLIRSGSEDSLWVLPKGRKNIGEDISAAAVRETYEETGYPCELMKIKMPTRATRNEDALDEVRILDGISECIAVQTRPLKSNIGGHKIVFWFICLVNGEQEMNTQMAGEDFQSEFFTFEEAISNISYSDDKIVLQRAIELVQHATLTNNQV